MKVYIGPYKNYFGVYQLMDKVPFLSEDRAENMAEFLQDTWLDKILLWIDKKRKRTEYIKIDRWDSWSADHTIAMITLPILKQLKETKHGAPSVEDSDVPGYLRAFNAPPVEDHDVDEHWFARFDYILDEMIWAFDRLANPEWEEDFYKGTIDSRLEDIGDGSGDKKLVKGPNDTFHFDKEGYMKVEKRIQNGLRLFAKYYRGLWD